MKPLPAGCPILFALSAKRFSLASQAFWAGRGWIFKACWVYPSDVCFCRTGKSPPGLWFIVRMSPPSYPSAWLLPSRARFRFTW